MNIALCRQGVMNGLTAVLILTCMQETYLLLAEHNKFADSSACTDPDQRQAAGMFMDKHCLEHKQLGDYSSARTILRAAYESNIWCILLVGLGIGAVTTLYDVASTMYPCKPPAYKVK